MFEQFRWNFRSPEERGDAGENIIYSALNKVRGRKALLPNCYIPVGQKGTTEIDMIFLDTMSERKISYNAKAFLL